MINTISTFKAYFLSSVAAGLVLTGTYADLQLKSNSFMYETKIDIVSFSAEETNRNVASRVHDFNLPAVSYFGVSAENKKKIDGRWEITRVLNNKGEAIFDSFKNVEDQKSIITVDMNLISTSTVILDKDQNQIFKISLLTDKNTIALFKVVNGGYEILEAKKIIKKAKREGLILAKSSSLKAPSLEKTNSGKKGIRISDMDLFLESALNPLQSRNILNITQVNGSISIFDGSIQDFSASLNSGTPKEVNLDFSFAEIKDGGQFEAEISGEMATGIITNNGEASYKIRFATGPLQGAILTFVSREKFEKTQESFANYEEKRELQQGTNSVEMKGQVQEADIERVPAEENQNDDVVIYRSNEKKMEYVAKYGFSFGNTSERKPASF